MGIKFLCVNADKVYLVPTSQIEKNRKIVLPDLAGRNALKVTVMYDSKGRFPFLITGIEFARVSFNDAGVYNIENAFESEEVRVTLQYANREFFETVANSRGEERIDPLPMPRGVAKPTDKEIICIESYLNRKFPELLKNSPNAIHQAIRREQQIHERQVSMMKNSYKS